MSLESPKAQTIYDREPKVLENYLKGKDEYTLKKIIRDPWKIPTMIEDDRKANPESGVLKRISMFSNKEIADKAQEVLDTRTQAGFFAV